MPLGAWMLLLVVSIISIGMIYGALTSKFVTSPEGIEHFSFGIQVKAAWNQVDKIEFTPDGSVNLLFRESVYTNGLARALRFAYPYDKTIQLSPYTGNVANSGLLKDIEKHISISNSPVSIAEKNESTKTYQEAVVIGLYYLGWFVAWFLFALGLQERLGELLATWGLSNAHAILTFVGLSLVIGLFVNSIILLKRYNVEITKLDANGVAHKARAYYLNPLVISLVSSLIGGIIPAVLPILLESRTIYVLVLFLIGRVALPISSRIERVLFQDSVQ